MCVPGNMYSFINVKKHFCGTYLGNVTNSKYFREFPTDFNKALAILDYNCTYELSTHSTAL